MFLTAAYCGQSPGIFFSPLGEGAVGVSRLGEFCSLQDSFRHASRATSLTEGGKCPCDCANEFSGLPSHKRRLKALLLTAFFQFFFAPRMPTSCERMSPLPASVMLPTFSQMRSTASSSLSL